MAKKNESTEQAPPTSQTESSPLVTSPLVEFEQIAICVPDIEKAIAAYNQGFGTTEWVRDRVTAQNTEGRLTGTTFQAELAFNYQLFPGKEFELIQIAEGISAQQRLRPMYMAGLSHMGLHVDSIEGYLEAHPELAAFPSWQLTETQHHTGTSRRYKYLLLETDRTLGFITKLIERVKL